MGTVAVGGFTIDWTKSLLLTLLGFSWLFMFICLCSSNGGWYEAGGAEIGTLKACAGSVCSSDLGPVKGAANFAFVMCFFSLITISAAVAGIVLWMLGKGVGPLHAGQLMMYATFLMAGSAAMLFLGALVFSARVGDKLSGVDASYAIVFNYFGAFTCMGFVGMSVFFYRGAWGSEDGGGGVATAGGGGGDPTPA